MKLLVMILTTGFLALAQSRVEGRVLTIDGAPVAKAAVALNTDGLSGAVSVSTGDDGKFAFENVAPGRYAALVVTKAGFIMQRSGSAIHVEAGKSVMGLVLHLTPEGVITGHVTDSDGDPVASATVSAQRFIFNWGHRLLSPSATSPTNDQGDFRISGLPPGSYYVTAEARPVGNTRSAAIRDVTRTTFYPSALDASDSKVLDVTAGGETRGINIQLRKGQVYSVRGKTVDPATNTSPAGLSILLVPLESRTRFSATTRPDGTFEFTNRPAGTYALQARPANSGTPAYAARMTLTIPRASTDNLLVPLTPSLEIAGSVKLEDHDLKSVLAATSSNSPTIALVEPVGNLLAAGPSSAIRADGMLSFQGVAPATYLLDVRNLPDGTYLKSLQFGKRNLFYEPLNLSSGGTVTIAVLLSRKASDLSGIARDSEGRLMSGVSVTVWPKTPNTGFVYGNIKQTLTDQDGAFKVAGLGPGEYFIAAWAQIETGLWQSSDFLARFDSDASVIRIGENEHAMIDPKLIPPERFETERAKQH